MVEERKRCKKCKKWGVTSQLRGQGDFSPLKRDERGVIVLWQPRCRRCRAEDMRARLAEDPEYAERRRGQTKTASRRFMERAKTDPRRAHKLRERNRKKLKRESPAARKQRLERSRAYYKKNKARELERRRRRTREMRLDDDLWSDERAVRRAIDWNRRRRQGKPVRGPRVKVERAMMLDAEPFRRWLDKRIKRLGPQAIAERVEIDEARVRKLSAEGQVHVSVNVVDKFLATTHENLVDLYAELGRHPTRPLLLGEAPHPVPHLRRAIGPPLTGRVARTLFKLADLEPGIGASDEAREYRALVEHFDVANLIPHPIEARKGKGDDFPLSVARRHALRKPLDGVVVILGRRVARAYQLDHLDWGEWAETAGGEAFACVIPHPSGVNVLMNDPEMRSLVSRVLGESVRYAAMWHKEVRS